MKCSRDGCALTAVHGCQRIGGAWCEEHWQTFGIVQPVPDPDRTLDGLRRTAGLPERPVPEPGTPVTTENLLEWRRRVWQIVRRHAKGGDVFTPDQVYTEAGPAPDPKANGRVTIEGLLMTAAHEHRTLVHLPTGEWQGTEHA